MENKVYCVFQDYGSWDDYANNLAGIFSTNEEAEDVKNQLTDSLAKFNADYPRPAKPVYTKRHEHAYEVALKAYGEAKDEWSNAVYASEKYEMMNVNHYSVVEKPLNQLFTEYKYFLAS